MEPVVIDIAGTIKELVKWALTQALLLLVVVLFGLSAPLLFTVGIEILVWRGADMSTWTPVYFMTGPFACAMWMALICHWHSIRQWRRAGKLDSWREDHGGFWGTNMKSVWFMFVGFFGSIVAEAIFLFTLNAVFQHNVERTTVMLNFAVAPLFVFAPVLLVLLWRWLRTPTA